MSLEKPIEQIVEADLLELIENKVSERKTVEYKQALPGRTDGDRKEFLADVSSFANASGGHLVYGMKEDGGNPVEICGLDLPNPDATVSALDSSIRDGIRPRIPGLVVWPVPLGSGLKAIVIHVPKSFASPHMVTFGGTSRFYARNSNGKNQLDVDEIRAAFSLSDRVSERVREFRLERIAKIQSGDTPSPLKPGGGVVLHIVPLDAFKSPAKIDPGEASSLSNKLPLVPLNHDFGGESWFNLDGLVRSSFSSSNKYFSAYIQIFRSGILETVDTDLLSDFGGMRRIPSFLFEEAVIKAARDYTDSLCKLHVEYPFSLMLTLVGVKGYSLAFNDRSFALGTRSFDRDVLLIPDLLIEAGGSDFDTLLKGCFDMVWNASGWARSMFYDESGKRKKN
jgi:Schlafen, AlbA_2